MQGNEGAGLRIVAVDDEPGILELLRAVFCEAAGFEFVGTGHDGDGAAQHEPDVMLIDIRMPGTSVGL